MTADGPTQNFENDVVAAAQLITNAIHENITLNISVGFGEVEGYSEVNGNAGAYTNFYQTLSYSTVRGDLIVHMTAGDPNISDFNSLPTASSIDGYSSIDVTSAQEKALGLISATDGVIDGYAGFAKDIPDTAMVGVAIHELTHAMGRSFGVAYNNPIFDNPDIFDLSRFTSPGNILVSPTVTSAPAYFSTDGGNTSLTSYGTDSDSSDFLNTTAPGDPLAEIYTDGFTTQSFTQLDLTQLDVLGFNTYNGSVTPTVNVQDIAVGEGQQVSESAFFTGVTNPSGDSITQYRFWDGAGDNGHIAFNGAAQADNQWNYVSAANLGSVTYVGGNQAGSENLYVAAYDATTGSWTPFAGLTAATHVIPTVNVKNVTVGEGQQVSESAFFTGVTNPSGDSITQYRFWDGAGDNGHIAFNGAAQADNQWIVVSAAQLGSVTYVGGNKAGNESLYVAAYDATTGSWTNYAGLTAATDVNPTVNVKNVTIGKGQQVSESAFFTGVTNPSGDSINQYAFWDSGGDKGHIAFNGAAQADNQWNFVSAAQLSLVSYIGGTTAGSESLYVDAHDATTGLWTAVGHLTATTT